MASSSRAAHNPRVLIYGSGAVGCFLGATLSEGGLPVTMLCRESQADALRRQGIRVEGSDPGASTAAKPEVITSIDQLTDQPDIALICVKAYDLEPALPDLLHLARLRALLITVQNGIGSEEYLLENIPSHQLSLAAASLTVSLDRESTAGVRRTGTQGGIAFAPVQPTPATGDRLSGLAAAFEKTGLLAPVVKHWQPMVWSKLLLNILGNATSAILAMPPAKLYRDARLFATERAAFFEALATMLGSGWFPVGLPGFNVPLLTQVMRLPPWLGRRLLAGRVGAGRGDKRPSLWVDVDRGRIPTEAGWLNGAVARQAEQLGIPAPFNRKLAELVDQLAADETKRDRFAGNPDALLRELGI